MFNVHNKTPTRVFQCQLIESVNANTYRENIEAHQTYSVIESRIRHTFVKFDMFYVYVDRLRSGDSSHQSKHYGKSLRLNVDVL